MRLPCGTGESGWPRPRGPCPSPGLTYTARSAGGYYGAPARFDGASSASVLTIVLPVVVIALPVVVIVVIPVVTVRVVLLLIAVRIIAVVV